MRARKKDDIAYQVVRSRRATADIIIERDGQVIVVHELCHSTTWTTPTPSGTRVDKVIPNYG